MSQFTVYMLALKVEADENATSLDLMMALDAKVSARLTNISKTDEQLEL